MRQASNVTVSSKFQIVIPAEIREKLKIRPGQQLTVLDWGGAIKLVPVRPLSELRGVLKGVPNDFEREPDREL